MEEQQNVSSRPATPRRRKPSPMQIFKERQLPLIILGIAAVLIVTIIAGSITRAVQRKQIATEASEAAAAEDARIHQEYQDILMQTEFMAVEYRYQEAIALIDSFSGKISDFPELAEKRAEYEAADAQLVTWSDPNIIVNLSFQMLVADPVRAFNDEEYGSSIKKNYITTTEFSNILEQLYSNGYVLVNPSDLTTTVTDDNGNTVFTPANLRLPAGKTPIIITQTNVNYDRYLVDGDGDGIADKDGSGYACKLVLDSDGSVVNEYVDASGNTLTGNYDLIPILDDFVAEHPDFSYNGAKAVIALTGHQGLFGHRTSAEHKETFGEAAHAQAVADATAVAQALIESGYELAYYTYSNSAYGSKDATYISKDLELWEQEVTPIIGAVDTIAFAQKSDITEGLIYMGDKHGVLQDAGFDYYLGFCNDGEPWAIVVDDYIRQGRILVGGSALSNNESWFAGMFDADAVIDKEARG